MTKNQVAKKSPRTISSLVVKSVVEMVPSFQVVQVDAWSEIMHYEIERIKVAKIVQEPLVRNTIYFHECRHPTYGTEKPGYIKHVPAKNLLDAQARLVKVTAELHELMKTTPTTHVVGANNVTSLCFCGLYRKCMFLC